MVRLCGVLVGRCGGERSSDLVGWLEVIQEIRRELVTVVLSASSHGEKSGKWTDVIGKDNKARMSTAAYEASCDLIR